MTMPTLPGVPEQIARYKLLSELGRGSMGHVYLALDPNIERKVALKIFLPLLKVGVAEQWELRQRFILEARAAGQLNHPGIVTIFDADTDADTGLSYLAMEWINGPSLDDLIRESGPLAVERSVSIARQVAQALDAAHRQGLVHRDIKPANILLESDGRAKVTDFGIAKLASMSITTTGWIPGSPFYMSPEQITNEGIDHRSDIYSLGAVLYQCLTGVLPFEAESLAALTHMILEIDPRPPQSINPKVTDGMAAMIRKALAKSPAERFDSGLAFARALEQAHAGQYEEAPEPRAAFGRGAPAAGAGELGAAVGTGTIGLAAAAAFAANPEFAAAQIRESELAAAPPEPEPDPEPVMPPAPADRPSRPRPARSFALALIAVGILLAVWSLRPVESEPTAAAKRVAAMLFSSAPRFGSDPSAPDSSLTLPAELGPPVEAEPSPAAAAVPTRAPEPRAVSRPVVESRAGGPGPRAMPAPSPAVVAAVEPEPDAGSSPAAPAAAVVSEPRVRATSTLELVYRNRLKSASLTVSVDGRKVWTEEVVSSPSLFKRVVGKNVWTSLDLTPGEHVVDVRVTGSEGKLDLVRQATAVFEDGRTHRLRVSLTPLKKLKLSWKEPNAG